METIDRLIQYVNSKDISINKFSLQIGVSNAYFSKQKKNKGSIGSHIIEKIVSIYTDLNIEWLITGNGNMLKEDIPIYKVSENNCEKLELEVKFLKREIDMKDQIITLLKDIHNVDDGELGKKVPLPKHKKLKHTHI